MSNCHWPSCNVGGDLCDDYDECVAEDRRRQKEKEEQKKAQRDRDIREQELRIKLMEKQLKEKPE